MIPRARSARTDSASSTDIVEPIASAAAARPWSWATCTARAASRTAAVLRSYSRTAAACSRRRRERLLMTSATAMRTAEVKRYSRSASAKPARGGTMTRSNAPTLSSAASTEGPRPSRVATTMVPIR